MISFEFILILYLVKFLTQNSFDTKLFNKNVLELISEDNYNSMSKNIFKIDYIWQ